MLYEMREGSCSVRSFITVCYSGSAITLQPRWRMTIAVQTIIVTIKMSVLALIVIS